VGLNGKRDTKKASASSPIEYTTSTGVTVVITGSSTHLAEKIKQAFELDEKWPVPVKPTYSVTDAAGGVTVYAHTETTLEVADNSEETLANKQAWAKYTQELALWEVELQKRQLKAAVLSGTQFDVPSDNDWLKPLLRVGAHVPEAVKNPKTDEDENERLWYYVETVIFGNTEDMQKICAWVFAGPGIDAEEMKAITGNFRGKVAG